MALGVQSAAAAVSGEEEEGQSVLLLLRGIGDVGGGGRCGQARPATGRDPACCCAVWWGWW
jgi:hypothetical protein